MRVSVYLLLFYQHIMWPGLSHQKQPGTHHCYSVIQEYTQPAAKIKGALGWWGGSSRLKKQGRLKWDVDKLSIQPEVSSWTFRRIDWGRIMIVDTT